MQGVQADPIQRGSACTKRLYCHHPRPDKDVEDGLTIPEFRVPVESLCAPICMLLRGHCLSPVCSVQRFCRAFR